MTSPTEPPLFDGRSPAEELARVFSDDRDRLRRSVMVRLDSRMLGRLDADDILQEGYLAAAKRLAHYRAERCDSMFVWARMVVLQTMVDLSRHHLGAKKRGLGREVALQAREGQDSSLSLLHDLCAKITSPTRAAARAEAAERLAATIGVMSSTDREILLLRHFEELTNGETAAVLGLHKAAATNRYLRAMTRLQAALGDEHEMRRA